jgi:uncharacterized protein involved in type VI secretion and phage assembly
MSRSFLGKYRGQVTDNQDPNGLGRVRATVPDVLGADESGWALPCAPFGGDSVGFYALPSVGARVWVEFERGDPDYPIWTGCFWGAQSQRASGVQSSPEQMLLLQTSGGQKVTLDDTNNQIILETSGGQKITLSSNGIVLDNGSGAKVELSNSKVSVNSGALEVE